ncbi:A/G-specific adenine glycosylase [Candidatus Omnitrophota bacterium]
MKPCRTLTSSEVRCFQRRIYSHYKQKGRVLPWRRTRNPYYILVSEIMLQQTQVKRVIEKYKEFIQAFPDIESLAKAPLRRVLWAWSGLGYNRRALALHKTAKIVVVEYDKKIPSAVESLTELPGIGNATASEICAFAFNKPTVFIETNIRSVFIHHFFKKRRNVHDNEIMPLIEQALDMKNPRQWYYALMDYGVVLKAQLPNPSRRSKHYVRQSPFQGSDRQIRGAILRLLIKKPEIARQGVYKQFNRSKATIDRILEQLHRDGLVKLSKDIIAIQ